MSTPIQLNSSARLSEHFTLGEFTRSGHPEIYNIPSHEAIANLKRLCQWLEVLRERYNAKFAKFWRICNAPEHKVIINSGYRSPQLNRKVGGAPTSNHLTGCAVDVRTSGLPQAIRYAAILLDYADETHQDFDELLIEKNRHGAVWLHFAVRPRENRRKLLFINA